MLKRLKHSKYLKINFGEALMGGIVSELEFFIIT